MHYHNPEDCGWNQQILLQNHFTLILKKVKNIYLKFNTIIFMYVFGLSNTQLVSFST